jgi:hypothetical protein
MFAAYAQSAHVIRSFIRGLALSMSFGRGSTRGSRTAEITSFLVLAAEYTVFRLRTIGLTADRLVTIYLIANKYDALH